MIESNASTSRWSKTAFLQNILGSETTTPEMGLSKHGTMSCDSATELLIIIAELTAVRDANNKYAKVQFMSKTELMSMVSDLLRRDCKANIFGFRLQAMLNSTENEHTLYIWNETGIE